VSKKQYCLVRLRERALELERSPKKSDMTREEVMLIKSFFGPWPRALEKAGLKPESKRKRRHNGHVRKTYT